MADRRRGIGCFGAAAAADGTTVVVGIRDNEKRHTAYSPMSVIYSRRTRG